MRAVQAARGRAGSSSAHGSNREVEVREDSHQLWSDPSVRSCNCVISHQPAAPAAAPAPAAAAAQAVQHAVVGCGDGQARVLSLPPTTTLQEDVRRMCAE